MFKRIDTETVVVGLATIGQGGVDELADILDNHLRVAGVSI